VTWRVKKLSSSEQQDGNSLQNPQSSHLTLFLDTSGLILWALNIFLVGVILGGIIMFNFLHIRDSS
jgi:hypothetical protein